MSGTRGSWGGAGHHAELRSRGFTPIHAVRFASRAGGARPAPASRWGVPSWCLVRREGAGYLRSTGKRGPRELAAGLGADRHRLRRGPSSGRGPRCGARVESGWLSAAAWRDAWDEFRRLNLALERLLTVLLATGLTVLLLRTYASCGKPLITTVVPFRMDAELMRLDQAIHLGHHPWRLLQPLLGHPAVTLPLDLLYAMWHPVNCAFVIWLAWSGRAPPGSVPPGLRPRLDPAGHRRRDHPLLGRAVLLRARRSRRGSLRTAARLSPPAFTHRTVSSRSPSSRTSGPTTPAARSCR